MTSQVVSVLCTIYDYTKSYTKSACCYTIYMLYGDAIIIRVLQRIAFQQFCVDFPVTDLRSFWKLWSFRDEFEMKCILYRIGKSVWLQFFFLEQLTLFVWKMIQKLCSMPLNDIRGQLYEFTIFETFDYMITRYKRNSVYENTLQVVLNIDMFLYFSNAESFLLLESNFSQIFQKNFSQSFSIKVVKLFYSWIEQNEKKTRIKHRKNCFLKCFFTFSGEEKFL